MAQTILTVPDKDRYIRDIGIILILTLVIQRFLDDFDGLSLSRWISMELG